MVSEQEAIQVATIITGAVAYAVSGYLQKVRKDEKTTFDRGKFAKTVLVGLVAGGAILVQDIQDIEVALAIAVPIVDEIVNTYIDVRRDGVGG